MVTVPFILVFTQRDALDQLAFVQGHLLAYEEARVIWLHNLYTCLFRDIWSARSVVGCLHRLRPWPLFRLLR